MFDHTVDHVLTKPGLKTIRAYVTGHDPSPADRLRPVAVGSRRSGESAAAAEVGAIATAPVSVATCDDGVPDVGPAWRPRPPADRRIALLLAVGGLAPSTAAAAFKARGGIRHAYVLDAKKGQRLKLVDAQGRVVGSGRADRLGSKMFRNVAPGRGYTRAARRERRAQEQGFRVLREGQNPKQSFYRRKTLKQGLNYVRVRDGVELAMTVRLPAARRSPTGRSRR